MNNQLRQFLKKIPGIYQLGRFYNQRVEARAEKERRAHLKSKGLVASQQVYEALKDTSLHYFITFGSLLGLCREGKFMDHDNDIDYGIVIQNDTDWQALQTQLLAKGFKVERYFTMRDNITEMTFSYKGLMIDFFAYYLEADGQMTAYIYKREGDVIYPSIQHFSVYRSTTRAVTAIEERLMNDVWVKVPENAEAYLADVYTENWRIPDPNWISTKSACYFAVPDEYGIQHIETTVH